jgi:hypothetical protein
MANKAFGPVKRVAEENKDASGRRWPCRRAGCLGARNLGRKQKPRKLAQSGSIRNLKVLYRGRLALESAAKAMRPIVLEPIPLSYIAFQGYQKESICYDRDPRNAV